MDITELQHIYASHPNVKGLAKQLENSSVRTFFLGGLHASASPLFFSSYLKNAPWTTIFILNDICINYLRYWIRRLKKINNKLRCILEKAIWLRDYLLLGLIVIKHM